MTRTLYVVMGMSGEYSDHREWPVRAFLDAQAAADLVVKASARVRGMETRRRRLAIGRYEGRAVPGQHEFDPQLWERDTTYYVMDVPLDDETAQDIAEQVLKQEEAGLLPRRAIRLTRRGVLE